MLRGVPFEWTFGLWPYWLFVNAMLLLTFYALDTRAYATEPAELIARDNAAQTRLGLRGGSGLLFLAVIIVAVAFVPSVDAHAIEHGSATLADSIPWREFVMIAAAVGSLLIGNRQARYVDNR